MVRQCKRDRWPTRRCCRRRKPSFNTTISMSRKIRKRSFKSSASGSTIRSCSSIRLPGPNSLTTCFASTRRDRPIPVRVWCTSALKRRNYSLRRRTDVTTAWNRSNPCNSWCRRNWPLQGEDERMDCVKIDLKLYLDDASDVELEAFIPVFHRWIQAQDWEDTLIDVADYRHV